MGDAMRGQGKGTGSGRHGACQRVIGGGELQDAELARMLSEARNEEKTELLHEFNGDGHEELASLLAEARDEEEKHANELSQNVNGGGDLQRKELASLLSEASLVDGNAECGSRSGASEGNPLEAEDYGAVFDLWHEVSRLRGKRRAKLLRRLRAFHVRICEAEALGVCRGLSEYFNACALPRGFEGGPPSEYLGS